MATTASTTETQRLKAEEAYQQKVQKLYEQTTKRILTLQATQVSAQKQAVVDMTRALESLVTKTTEMVGFMIGQLMTGSDIAGKSLFANFLDMLGQFSVLLGTMAVAASKVLEMLFTGNPAGLFLAGLAMVMVGGVIKAFAASLRADGLRSNSASGVATTSASSTSSGSSGLSQAVSTRQENSSPSTTIVYQFSGGLYDERGLARIAATAINRYSGRYAPLLDKRVIGGV